MQAKGKKTEKLEQQLDLITAKRDTVSALTPLPRKKGADAKDIEQVRCIGEAGELSGAPEDTRHKPLSLAAPLLRGGEVSGLAGVSCRIWLLTPPSCQQLRNKLKALCKIENKSGLMSGSEATELAKKPQIEERLAKLEAGDSSVRPPGPHMGGVISG